MLVTLDIFSGMPNPSWSLSETATRELMDRVAAKALPSLEASEGALGYRSFIVAAASDDESAIAGLPDVFRVGGMVPEAYSTPHGVALPALTAEESDNAALWLLTTAGKAVDDELLGYVETTIKERKTATQERAVRKEREIVEEAVCVIRNTPYNPAFWNRPGVQPHNNCYNYAMNYRSDTFAQPGRISGHPNSIMQCANVAPAANWDGCTATCSGSNKNVALVVWPGRDYHWYRRHSNGFWGHKPGQTPARNTDNSNRVIGGNLTPRNCNRGPYRDFCGYRYSPTGMHVR